MSKLKELVNSIKAFTVVIIENDFTYLENPYKILAKYCFTTKEKRERLDKDLRHHQFNDLVDNFNRFSAAFDVKEHKQELIEAIPASDNFKHYLEKMEFTDLLEDKVFDLIAQSVEQDNNVNIFKDVFLKHGYFSGYTNIHYDAVLEEFQNMDSCNILFYKNIPPTDREGDFIEDIRQSVEETSSNFYLAIIDKSLEAGGDDEAGKTFVNHLIELNEDNKLNFIGCIFTSRLTPNVSEPDIYNDYFIQEVDKNGLNTIDDIAKILAHSAYASVFNSIKVNTVSSSEKALTLVLKNQKNIKYIIDESHKEGLPAYEAIKYWFNLFTQKNFDDEEVNDFDFISGLTAFFKNDYLDDHPKLSEISPELQKLNTYELFDYNINKKHSPIAPGDIWECEGNYYILMGQLCDLLLRKENLNGEKNTRNSKVGELIRFKVNTGTQKKGKFTVVVEDNKKSIYINNFFDNITDTICQIKIDMTTPNIYFADLSVLDLCMFNKDGECKIDTEKELDYTIKNLLSENKDIYYESLKKQYSSLSFNNLRQLVGLLNFSDPLDFSKMKFIQEDNLIRYGIRRIGKLKGRYYDSLYNNYLNNKGRIDLNLIDNAPIRSKEIVLNCQLSNDVETKKTISINLYENRTSIYLSLPELKSKLPKEFEDLLNGFDEEFDVSTKKYAEFNQLKDSEYELKILYSYDGKTVSLNMENYDHRFLFKANGAKYEKLEYKVNGDDTSKNFKDNKPHWKDLKTGITILETKEEVKILNGFIKIESLGQN